MRLIDADNLKNDLMDIAHNEFVPDEYRQFCLAMAERVSKEPAIEAEPVRHGRWIDLRESSKDVPKSRCSECNRVIIGLESWYKYCPYCGAKMDKEVSE